MKTCSFAIVVITLCGCATEPLPKSVAVSLPPSAGSYQPTGEVSVPAVLQTASHASEQTAPPNAKRDGVSSAVIKAMVNSVGRNRNDLMAVLGVPDDTKSWNPDNDKVCWSWTIIDASRLPCYIYASTSNKSKSVEHIFIDFSREVTIADLSGALSSLEPKIFWGGDWSSSKTYYVAVATRTDGQSVRIYTESKTPLVVNKPFINGDGQRVDQFVRNPSFLWSAGTVRRIAIGEKPLLNANADGFLLSIGTWVELGR